MIIGFIIQAMGPNSPIFYFYWNYTLLSFAFELLENEIASYHPRLTTSSSETSIAVKNTL